MKIIAHRALLDGPCDILENNPNQIETAISLNYDIEIDVRYSYGCYWLGHDACQYETDIQTLNKWSNKNQIYLHCKDILTLQIFLKESFTSNIIPFFHENDPCILLINGKLWVHPNNELDANINPENSIFVLSNLKDINLYKHTYGICTDYANYLK